MIYDIIRELNKENGSNYKQTVLVKYKDNELFKRVLKMTYDRVAYTYGVTSKNIFKRMSILESEKYTLNEALDFLENNICTRKITGHDALDACLLVYESLNKEDADVFMKIIDRDLKINLGRTTINKIFKDLIAKPVYMRCDVYSTKTSKNISFANGAYVQLKADGTYREITKDGDHLSSRSRSGEEYEYPVIFEQMRDFPDGVYMGELTVRGITDRAEGNGLINSDNPPHDDIMLDLWDYVTPQEYQRARVNAKSNPCTTSYIQRFETLYKIINQRDLVLNNVRVIPYKVVYSLKDALEQTSKWMDEGFEGSILKDLNGVFKDGTSKHQLKLKLQISAEMRITGFQDGTPGTKREGKVGSIVFENDEGTIKGRTSGFDDKLLEYFTNNKEALIGKIIEVQFNDLSKARNNDFYALSHPRFIEIRDDKNETDTLEKVKELRAMALELK
jgi:DNA ligase-1